MDENTTAPAGDAVEETATPAEATPEAAPAEGGEATAE